MSSFTDENAKTVVIRKKQPRSSQAVRNSFLYRSDSKINSQPALDSLSENIPFTPFSNILEKIKKTKDKISEIKTLATKNGETGTINQKEIIKILSSSEFDLDGCIENLLTLPMDKSIREMAAEYFQELLNNELSNIINKEPNAVQVSNYISENFTESGEKVPEESIPRTAKLSRNRTFRSEIKFNNDIKVYHKQKKLTVIPNVDKWGIDIFTIEEQFPNRVLTVMAYTIFMNYNLDEKLNISPQKMTKFLVQLEENYHKDVIYHNSTHAADVLQCVNVFLHFPCFEGIFSDCEIFAAIVAASIHDLDHPGLSNHFLIRTDSDLATTYNDISVLENHHVSTAFKLIKKPGIDILSSLKKTEQVYIRKIIIEMVLGTDMSKHYDHVAQMINIAKTFGEDIKSERSSADRLNFLKSIIHCADISSSTRPNHIYTKWVERVTNEFFIQGDLEKFLGYEPSPLCDRNNIDIKHSQSTFIEYVALPLWETWAQIVYPSAEEMLSQLQENKNNLGEIKFLQKKNDSSKIIKKYGLKHFSEFT